MLAKKTQGQTNRLKRHSVKSDISSTNHKWIRLIKNEEYTPYRFDFRINHILHSKSFKTLEEGIEYKMKYIKGIICEMYSNGYNITDIKLKTKMSSSYIYRIIKDVLYPNLISIYPNYIIILDSKV